MQYKSLQLKRARTSARGCTMLHINPKKKSQQKEEHGPSVRQNTGGL